MSVSLHRALATVSLLPCLGLLPSMPRSLQAHADALQLIATTSAPSNNVGFYQLVANCKTDVAVTVCTSTSQFQLRSGQADMFINSIFPRSTICPAGVTGSWRAVAGVC